MGSTDLTISAWRSAISPLSDHPVGNVPNRIDANRAMVVGDLLASGPAIAIGTPGAGAPGSVSLFMATASAVTCAGILNAPALVPGGEQPGSAQTLAIGDFDGDGVPDLLVGAPPSRSISTRGRVAPGGADGNHRAPPGAPRSARRWRRGTWTARRATRR